MCRRTVKDVKDGRGRGRGCPDEGCVHEVQVKLDACMLRMKQIKLEEERIVGELFDKERMQFGKGRFTTSREDTLRRRHQALQLRREGLGPLVPLVLPRRQKGTALSVVRGGALFSPPESSSPGTESIDPALVRKFNTTREQQGFLERLTASSTISYSCSSCTGRSGRLPPMRTKYITHEEAEVTNERLYAIPVKQRLMREEGSPSSDLASLEMERRSLAPVGSPTRSPQKAALGADGAI
eukprot:TRINITY_DN6043_c0_g1_i1.p2 TRINITY_DN6043_c0_g1~~TRINITY_DN6043_c0_g1_i1.p2  ORF type:complete len:240 (+),score=73.17 TRINITY_DN6043_c0_g1_i1:65-784(+)